MRVVFLQDVPNVAKAGEIKEVAPGYARNFLIPKKLALVAKPQALSQVETIKRTKVKEKEKEELAALAQQIEGKEITIKAKAGAKGRLYGSITSGDIADGLSKSTALAIDKRKIELEEPIRQLGSHEVSIRLAKDTLPKIRVNIIEEETPKEEKAPKKARKAEETPKEEKAPKKKAPPKKAPPKKATKKTRKTKK